MNERPHEAYLDAQVRTASPQKLRLMLIEGALRLAQQAYDGWSEPPKAETIEALSRCRQIILELHGSIRTDVWEPAKQVVAIYQYLYESLCHAQLDRNPVVISDAIKVLEAERETWVQVCQAHPTPIAAPRSAASGEIVAPSDATGGATYGVNGSADSAGTGDGVSLEA